VGFVEIVNLEKEHLTDALALVWEVFSEFEAPEYSAEGIEEFRNFVDFASISEKVASGELLFRGCYEGGELAGIIATRGHRHICLLFVRKQYHRRGIGRRLFMSAEADARDNGIVRMTVNSSPYAAGFYHRLGFADKAEEQTLNGIRFTPMEHWLCRRTRCILIHGLGSGIQEMKPAAEHLEKLGYDVSCPLLSGHCASKDDMRKASYSDWIESVETELLKSNGTDERFFLIGSSLGGLIALDLACRYSSVGTVVTINTPIFDINLHQLIENCIGDIASGDHSHMKLYAEVQENTPFSSVLQLLLLQREVKERLDKLSCPVLVIQAEDDEAARIESADYIYRNVSSGIKEVKYFPNGGHLILLSPQAEEVASCIGEFLRLNGFTAAL
jgi:carboxylesterase